jgi:hypothetical protein
MGATGVACAGIEIATMKATATILIMFSSQGMARNDDASDTPRHRDATPLLNGR